MRKKWGAHASNKRKEGSRKPNSEGKSKRNPTKKWKSLANKGDGYWKMELYTKTPRKQWGLIPVAVEEANIIYHNLTRKAATNMRGRPNITFKECVHHLQEGIGQEDDTTEVGWLTKLRKAAGEHTALPNQLINVGRRMKANVKHKGDPQKLQTNHKLNASTMEAYSEQADKISGRLHLTAE